MKIKLITLFVFISTSLWAEGFLPVAHLIKKSGEIFINSEKANPNDEVALGMEIKNKKPGAFGIIKLQNGHLLRLNNGIMSVGELDPKNALFDLKSGKLYIAVKPLTENEKFSVLSFGTKIHFSSDSAALIESVNNQTNIYVSKGKVEIEKGSLKNSIAGNQIFIINEKLNKSSKVQAAREPMNEIHNKALSELSNY